MLSSKEITAMTSVVANSLDVSLPVSRKSTTDDGYGHSTETWTSQGNMPMNVFKPSVQALQTYAGVIGAKRALMIRYMSTSDIREGDRVTYQGKAWLVQSIENAESYSFSLDALVTEVQ